MMYRALREINLVRVRLQPYLPSQRALGRNRFLCTLRSQHRSRYRPSGPPGGRCFIVGLRNNRGVYRSEHGYGRQCRLLTGRR